MGDGQEKEEAAEPTSEGLTGVRADFVASLGRKVGDARKAKPTLSESKTLKNWAPPSQSGRI